MVKRKRIEGVNSDFLLPEAMIQHIQAFLSGKQAAQTSILSKSWYSAWSTRPNLDFDQHDFRRSHEKFAELAKKTMHRYEELDLKIDSLKLRVKCKYNSLTHKLIVKAMKLGATDLNLEWIKQIALCFLPTEVLGSKTLIRLSVVGCVIALGADRKVSCSRLKTLSLCGVILESDIIWDIISRCPLIEKLIISDCICFLKVPGFDVSTNMVRQDWSILQLSPFHGFRKHNVGSVVDCSIESPSSFDMLKCLFVDKVHIDTLFFRDFSSKFPCLRDLTVHDCYGYKAIVISSPSLECISFKQDQMLRAKFVIPNIRNFRFSSSNLPSMSFKTASGKWKSDISITCNRLSTPWFLRLKKFLAKLSLSEISLSLEIGHFSGKSFDYARDVEKKPRPVLENLNLSMRKASGLCSAHLDGLFWICHPKFITQCWLPKPQSWEIADGDLLELLTQTLVQEVREHYYIPNQNVYGLHDLEAVNLEIFEESLAEWRPLSWKTLFDASTSLEKKQKVRFQLTWA